MTDGPIEVTDEKTEKQIKQFRLMALSAIPIIAIGAIVFIMGWDKEYDGMDMFGKMFIGIGIAGVIFDLFVMPVILRRKK